jgi:hypothetical protein
LLDELDGPLDVPGGQRMLGRLGCPPVLFVPLRRPRMQFFDVPGTLTLQTAPQEVCEEVMVTIPAPLLVQRDDEEVLPLQFL